MGRGYAQHREGEQGSGREGCSLTLSRWVLMGVCAYVPVP